MHNLLEILYQLLVNVWSIDENLVVNDQRLSQHVHERVCLSTPTRTSDQHPILFIKKVNTGCSSLSISVLTFCSQFWNVDHFVYSTSIAENITVEFVKSESERDTYL